MSKLFKVVTSYKDGGGVWGYSVIDCSEGHTYCEWEGGCCAMKHINGRKCKERFFSVERNNGPVGAQNAALACLKRLNPNGSYARGEVDIFLPTHRSAPEQPKV